MNEIENAIEYFKNATISFSSPEAGAKAMKVRDLAINALQQQLTSEPTAIEFLRKAKAIWEIEDTDIDLEIMFNIIDCICGTEKALSESDLVRKVMDYRLEDKDE